jgi:basic membrane protein A and related proteins
VKKYIRGLALAGALTLAVAACGEKPNEGAGGGTTNEANKDFKGCMVSDSGGFDDKSFNQTSHDGLVKAEEDMGVQTGEVESNAPSEFADNIQAMVDEDCESITTVGFLLGDATLAAAKKNKDVDFSIVDFAYPKAPDNLKGLTFNTAEPSYLAGYLAAAKSETGVVGTFGGLPIPTVTIFMTGFVQGVEKYNEDNGANVKVIGWDPETEKGSFTNDFESKTKGQSTAEEMITQGADVIMPVAGPAGLGGLQAAQDNDVWGIWVDTDGCVSAAEYCDNLLTSVMKGMDVAVETAIKDSASGKFSNEVYEGTLENGGVALAPYGPQAEIDSELDAQIQDLKQQIIDGEIKVG